MARRRLVGKLLKPAPFDYQAPATLVEAIALLAQSGGEAKVLAGGQSLIPLMAFRLSRPSLLVDLRQIGELRGHSVENGVLRVGAMETHRDVELDRELMNRCRLLAEGLAELGHVAIRNAGTVGGSMAHADPAAEWPAIAVALDAEFDIAGPGGTRAVPASDFFTGWMTTSLASDEILTSVRFRLPSAAAGSAFVEVARRHGDFAIAGVAAVVWREQRLVERARIVLAGSGTTPIRAMEAEAMLVGSEPTPSVIEAVSEAIESVADPIADLHGGVAYKRRLAGVLGRRSIERAYARAARA